MCPYTASEGTKITEQKQPETTFLTKAALSSIAAGTTIGVSGAATKTVIVAEQYCRAKLLGLRQWLRQQRVEVVAKPRINLV